MGEPLIYEKLRKFRRARGVSVDQLAQEIGEDSQKVGRIERGQRSLTVDYLLKVAKALHTPIEAMIQPEEAQRTAGEPAQVFDANILNAVVVFIEQWTHKMSSAPTAEAKAKMISKIYENLLKLPADNRYPFFCLLRESFNIVFQNE